MTALLRCDAHMHVFEESAASQLRVPPQAGVRDYRRVQERLGLRRTVVVQPRHYVTDNTVLLEAIDALGRAETRGIAVVSPNVEAQELRRLDEGGVTGIRFSLGSLPDAPFAPRKPIITIDMLAPLAARIGELGWHIQLHLTAEQIVEYATVLRSIDVPIVFDHMARLPPVEPARHPAFDIVSELIEERCAWVKLSAPYLCARSSARERWPGADVIARTWIEHAPHRLVWGSDWPHVTEQPDPPDVAVLLRLLDSWAGSESTRRMIMVDNPALLYRFDQEARSDPVRYSGFTPDN